MTNNQLTKEWLQQTIAELESVRDEIPFGIDTNSELELAAFKMALAAMDSEPVILYRERNPYNGLTTGWQELTENELSFLKENAGENAEFVTLYRHAQPAVVLKALERMRSIVSDPRALPRRKEWISGQQYSYVLLEEVEAMVDEACRAAMLQAEPVTTANKLGNSPVIPDGYVMVPREPTSEMIWAAKYCFTSTPGWDVFKSAYIAMLAAAPQEVPDGK